MREASPRNHGYSGQAFGGGLEALVNDPSIASSARRKERPHYHGHRERLRERFLQAGPDAVSDYELLELVLFRAIPQRDVKPLAKELIEKFGSFGEVIAAPSARLA